MNGTAGVIKGGQAVLAPTAPQSLTNQGAINGTSSAAAAAALGGGSAVANSGAISGAFQALKFDGGSDSLTNSGQMTATSSTSAAVEVGGGSTVINNGAIGGFFGALQFDSGDDSLTNSGQITATSASSAAVTLGGGSYVTNSGAITGVIGALQFSGGDDTLTNSGQITATVGTAISFTSGVDDAIHNTATGIISGKASAILATTTSHVVFNEGQIFSTQSGPVIELGSYSRVNNAGSITGSFEAVQFDGGANWLDNSGTLSVTSADAVGFSGAGLHLINSGKISAYQNAIYLGPAASGVSISNLLGGIISARTYAVSLDGVSTTLTNFGQIAVTGSVAIAAGGGTNDVIHNGATGVISGQIVIDGAGAGLTLFNQGSLSATGTTHAIGQAGGGAHIWSSGAITGVTKALDLAGDDDVVTNSGRIAVTGDDAIALVGDNLRLNNSGELSAYSNTLALSGSASSVDMIVNHIGGVITAQAGYALQLTTGSAHVFNAGVVTGDIDLNGASRLVNTGDCYGSIGFYGGGARIYNSGKISYDGAPPTLFTAIQINSAVGSNDSLVNAAGGVIAANGGWAIKHNANGAMNIDNFGQVFGLIDLKCAASLVNAGQIDGYVTFEAANTLAVNRGVIAGDLTFAGTGNVYNGVQGQVSGAIHGAGTDGRYYGGVAADTFDMTLSGAAYVNGGGGDDTFLFTAAGLTAATTLIGGDGNDTLTFTTAGALASSAFAQVSSVEIINLFSGPNTLALTNAIVGQAQGGALTVNGGASTDTLSAAGVTNANDTVTLYGGRGADLLTASGAKDVFLYTRIADSYGPSYDTITAANFAVDRFDVSAFAGSVLAVDTAVTTGSLSTATFNADLTADLKATNFGAHHAVLFTASAGTLAGATFLVVDADAAAGYQANRDLVIRLNNATGALTTASFT